MPFCPNCGQQAEGRFCAACGATIGAAPGPQASTPPPQYEPNAQAAGLQENVACALCYVLGLITGILFLAIAPYNQNPRIRFHAFQSIFFHIAVICFSMASVMLGYLLGDFLAILYGLLSMVIGFGIFFLWLFLIWKAYNGDRFELPVVGSMAAAQAGR